MVVLEINNKFITIFYGSLVFILKETIMNLKETIQNDICFIKNNEFKISSKKLGIINVKLLKLIINETNFLNEHNPTITDRLKYILNNKFEINRCKYCNVEMINLKNKFCSYKCSNNSEETKNKFRESYNKLTEKEKKERNNKRGETFNTRYGGYTLKSNSLSKKVKKTMLKKYGVEHSGECEISNNKRINTWVRKYGYDNPSKAEKIKKKIKIVLFERYGVTNASLINSDENIIKTYKTKIERGLIILDIFLSDYRKYRKGVNNLTRKNYFKYKKYINPNNYKRVTNGNDGYQLDHIFSVFNGFIDGINVEIISHPCNLQMLHWSINRKKWKSSTITENELKIKIKEFKDEIY